MSESPHKKSGTCVRNIFMLIIIFNIRHTNSNMFIFLRAAVLYFSRHCRPFITNQQPAIHRRNKVAQRTPSEVERVKGLIYGIPKPKIWGRVLKSFHVFIVQPHFQTRRERLLPQNRTSNSKSNKNLVINEKPYFKVGNITSD